MSILENITDRKAAESLHRTIGELLTDEVPRLPSAQSRVIFFQMLKASAEKNLPATPKPLPATPKPKEPRRQHLAGDDSTVDDALDLIDEIETLASEICENGRDFAEDVLEKAKSIGLSVERGGHATDKQLAALENMAEGLRAWFHD